jgi:uncharacterized membrane protein/uncharacterized membrane protein YbhN (UPF0104 family)
MQVLNNRFLNILKYLLGWPFSIVAFIFILRLILPHIPSFSSNLQSLNLYLLLTGIGCFLLFYFIRAYVWHRLLKIHTKNITYKKAAYLWSVSELKRYIPGNFWGFLGRTLLFSDTGIKKQEIGKLVIVEAGIFVLSASAVSLLSLPFITRHLFPFIDPFVPLIIAGLIIAWILFIFNHKIIKFLSMLDPQETLFMLVLSASALLFFGLGNYLIIGSFTSLPVDLVFQLSGFFILSLLLGFTSLLTPAGFGVREGIIIAGLSKIVPVAVSAFGALFARVSLVLTELVFIALIFFIHKTKNKYFLKFETWIANNKHEAILIFMVLIYIVYFTLVSFLRHDHFYTGKFDLGNMVQTVWNTTQGRIFEFTNPNGTDVISRLAFHADFILIFLAPIYAIIPSPKTLLFIQTLVVGTGSYFVYKIAAEKLKNKNIALAFAFSFLLNPGLQRANIYDFHPVTLATTFLLAAFYFYKKKQYLFFGLFAFLAGISKEQIWVIVALFGALMVFEHKKRFIGSIIFTTSMAITYILITVIIPGLHGSSHFALSYFSELGDGPLGIIRSIIFSPDKILGIILEKSRIDYLNQLFSPVGYLALFFPFYLIFAMPDLLINLLSSNIQLHQIYYHYTAAITPFLYICSIYAVGIISKYMPKKYTYLIIIYLLSSALISAYRYGPLPGAKDANLDMFTKQAENHQFIKQEIAKIPVSSSVASSNNIGAHLSHRRILYTLPLGIDKAEYVVFLLNASEQPDSLQIERVQFQKLKNNPDYEKISENGNFFIYKRVGI